MSSFIRHLTCIQGLYFYFFMCITILFHMKIKMFVLFTGAVQTTEGLKKMPVREGVTTSEIVKFFNDIFDSMNDRKGDLKKDKNDT